MSDKLGPKEIVTFEELLMSNTFTQEALINILVKKGLINKQEILDEVRNIRRENIKGK